MHAGSRPLISERVPAVAAATVAFIALDVLATLLVVAGYGFDAAALGQRGALVDSTTANPGLLRVGALIDLVGYLCLAPLVLWAHGQLAWSRLSGVAAAAGMGFVLCGAIGAALLGSVGPWLLETAATDPATHASVRIAFGALENAVIVGVWGTLELLLLGLWLWGVSWIVRAQVRRFAWLGLGAGLGALGYGLRSALTGSPPLPTPGPIDIVILAGVGLMPVWLLWLALRLWRGR